MRSKDPEYVNHDEVVDNVISKPNGMMEVKVRKTSFSDGNICSSFTNVG
jgi:hypothetical protein